MGHALGRKKTAAKRVALHGRDAAGCCFSYNMLRITSHSIAKSIVDFIANSICGSISITQPVRTLWILSCKIRKSPLQYRERAFTKKAGAEQGMKAQKCKGIKGVKG